jgi:hypothetical protein
MHSNLKVGRLVSNEVVTCDTPDLVVRLRWTHKGHYYFAIPLI